MGAMVLRAPRLRVRVWCGIVSPAWYELMWEKPAALGAQWLTRAARLLRAEDIPASSAHVIEACRLADTLAAVRDRPIPGLTEYQEAAVAVLGAGDETNLRLIDRRWHFDGRLGRVPEDFPAAPLQRDLTALQKRLRLPAAVEEKTLDLDLRETLDRERSHLLRRLRILGVEWAKPAARVTSGKGTFHEIWQLLWHPEYAVRLVEASRYGHTVASAATTALAEKSTDLHRLADLVGLLDDALFADLADAIQPLVTAIEQRAAAQADVLQLLEAIAPLVNVYRYGNVRATDVTLVRHILDAVVPRVLVGLLQAAANIDSDAAAALWKQVRDTERALNQLAGADFLTGWRNCLGSLASGEAVHPLIAERRDMRCAHIPISIYIHQRRDCLRKLQNVRLSGGRCYRGNQRLNGVTDHKQSVVEQSNQIRQAMQVRRLLSERGGGCARDHMHLLASTSRTHSGCHDDSSVRGTDNCCAARFAHSTPRILRRRKR